MPIKKLILVSAFVTKRRRVNWHESLIATNDLSLHFPAVAWSRVHHNVKRQDRTASGTNTVRSMSVHGRANVTLRTQTHLASASGAIPTGPALAD